MKTRIDIRIDKDLKDFLQRYAEANHSTISRILIDYIVRLKKNHAPLLAHHYWHFQGSLPGVAKNLPIPDLSETPEIAP